MLLQLCAMCVACDGVLGRVIIALAATGPGAAQLLTLVVFSYFGSMFLL